MASSSWNEPSSEALTCQAKGTDTAQERCIGSAPTPSANLLTTSLKEQQDLTHTVAKHYNELQESGREERTKSRIFYLRNFNNWIKSMAIGNILERIRGEKDGAGSITVLDLCCGKGGDLLKWKKGRIDHLVCADIAGTSVEQCETRYKENQERDRWSKSYTAEFITADCTKVRLKDKYQNPDLQFDLVSCQFSFHYCFESLRQAEVMLQNACECLRPGGYFIGTTPNANELVKRLRASDDMSFGNDVYRVTFKTEDKVCLPAFGAKYDFHLEGVVDCPEFLVYFPLLEEMAKKYGMKLVHKIPFADYFDQQIKNDRGLIGKMQALECFPAEQGTELVGATESYGHARQHCDQQAAKGGNDWQRRPVRVGTLSQPEWEAATIYLVFLFQREPVSVKARRTPAEDNEMNEGSPAKQARMT